MSGIWGNNIRLSIFGESHGKAIGINIDGLPPGIELNIDLIKAEMKRRAPGNDEFSTSRKEADSFDILSGFFNDRTTGTPLCVMIQNKDQRSKDYEKTKTLMRPSHGDYPGYVKYDGYNDYRGGGHFSGRVTAAIVFAGAICKQILALRGITLGSHIKSIYGIEDDPFNRDNINSDLLIKLRAKSFPVINEPAGEKMRAAIAKARDEKDSVGGIIECAAVGINAGLGEPFFDSAESVLSHILFSIPGVKGIEFGEGFAITQKRGSDANDEYYFDQDEVKTYTNNNGGISGGITNGMPLIFRIAVKPTPSIGKMQRTIDTEKQENTHIEINGRHDPCIVPRAVPVAEAAAAIAILDLMLWSERK